MSDSNSKNENLILDDEKPMLLDHDYDGIQELDNPLPGWWLTTFLITIIFAFIYYIHYELGGGPSLTEELAQDLKVVKERQAQNKASAQIDVNLLASALSDQGKILSGKTVYVSKCASCHGQQGEGGIGPNLTDDHWIHGKGQVADIAQIVRDGVGDKGMPPWGSMLSGDELVNVAAFVKSVRGTQPPNGKGPQGTLIKE